MSKKLPKDPLTPDDCREITTWLRAALLGLTQPKTQARAKLRAVCARWETHSYAHRRNVEQAAANL